MGPFKKYVTPEREGVTECDRGGGVSHCVMSRLWIFFNLWN